MWKDNILSLLSGIGRIDIQDQNSLDNYRARLLESVENIRNLLLLDKKVKHSKYSIHLMVFAFVSYCDEKLNIAAFSNKLRYQPLQYSVFSVSNSGDVFYDYLEDILCNDNYSEGVLWTYTLVLKLGFLGKYSEKTAYKRSLFIKQLEKKGKETLSLVDDKKKKVKKGKLVIPPFILWLIPVVVSVIIFGYVSII